MSHPVDPFRFTGGIIRRMAETWMRMERPLPIPWTPLAKPLSECRVALLTSGGAALKSDRPFDQQGERDNPWWGDPSFRILPKSARAGDIKVYHLHINPALAEQDLNCILPLERLDELESEGFIGQAAPRAYSMMGYILEPDELLQKTAPEIIRCLKEDRVDALVLVPT